MSSLKDIFTTFRPKPMNFQQAKAVKDILACKTSALGGHVEKCDTCEEVIVHYNSCRNRHCPLCQAINSEIWTDKRRPEILDAPYFHVVFTMPQELQDLVYQNQKLLYSLMYKSVAETLKELCQDKKFLGANIGFISVLHTWSQDLRYHPHLHVMVLGGGLTPMKSWRKFGKNFFIPVKVLSKKFRGKFLYYLKDYYRQGELNSYSIDDGGFKELLDSCYKINWYVYTKKTFKGPLKTLKYLSNYTQRIAISESRILEVNTETVTFNVRDRQNGRKKTVTLKGAEFVRRFLMHILPKGFVKVRFYGLLSSRNKKENLRLCRRLTCSTYYAPLYEGLSKLEIVSMLLGRDLTICPHCKTGKLEIAYRLAAGFSP